jgi:lipopolysaccharide/colanic/teichoic acid biosynthesis glycosyltransferase
MTRWFSVRLVLDRVVAATVGVVLAPMVGVLAVLATRGTDGPAFVRVERIGRDFRPFQMWKIRSMRAETSEGLAGGVALTSRSDQRVTPTGRWLRQWHLDELPQLLNVLKGEMLLVGPRPEAREFVDFEDEGWAALLRVPPGIFGPTQLMVSEWETHWVASSPDGSAYRDVVLPVKLAIDKWYVETMSPRLDLDITWAMAKWLVASGGRTRLRSAILREVPASRRIAEDFPAGPPSSVNAAHQEHGPQQGGSGRAEQRVLG